MRASTHVARHVIEPMHLADMVVSSRRWQTARTQRTLAVSAAVRRDEPKKTPLRAGSAGSTRR